MRSNPGRLKALFRNLVFSLVKQGRIKTTQAKAKAIRGLVDKLVILAKKGDLAARRRLVAFLKDRKIVNKLIGEIAPKFGTRPSGFTRIVSLGRRLGDGAMMVKMEFVEPTIAQPVTQASGQKKSPGVVKKQIKRD